MRRLPILTIVLVLLVLSHRAEAQGQGQGRPKNPQASSESGGTATTGGVSTSQFRQFGVWLDDATTRAEGGGSVGLGMGYWRGAGASLLDIPMLDGSYAVTDRFQLGMSVPFYQSGSGETTSRGVDDMYFSGKIVLVDPALKDARFGIAVSPVLGGPQSRLLR